MTLQHPLMFACYMDLLICRSIGTAAETSHKGNTWPYTNKIHFRMSCLTSYQQKHKPLKNCKNGTMCLKVGVKTVQMTEFCLNFVRHNADDTFVLHIGSNRQWWGRHHQQAVMGKTPPKLNSNQDQDLKRLSLSKDQDIIIAPLNVQNWNSCSVQWSWSVDAREIIYVHFLNRNKSLL